MRLCRFQNKENVDVALYMDDVIVPINTAAAELKIPMPAANHNLMDYLASEGRNGRAAVQLAEVFAKSDEATKKRLSLPTASVKIKVPVPRPEKIILLAGNYASHIIEGGGQAPERVETFPYFFQKPPSTTLADHGSNIMIPRVSPNHVDWEIELGVVIGKKARHVNEKEALSYVAGYTVCNDVSDRRFKINPERKQRDKDSFFDWQHGKWHDTFLPMGPCVRSAHSLPDPQKMHLQLKVNGKIMQDANTGQMIFPVAAIVSILSSFTTLEPGDIIVTGTPAGVGAARKPPIFLKAGDEVTCEIEGIGLLRNPVVDEKS